MRNKSPYYINVRWASFSKVLKWLLSNRSALCANFTSKECPIAPMEDWWLVAVIVQHCLLFVNITFRALQVDSAFVSKKYGNQLELLVQLHEHCSAERDESIDVSVPVAFDGDSLSGGEFKIPLSGIEQLQPLSGIEQLLRRIDDSAAEIAAKLDLHPTERIIRACAVIV